MPNPLENKHIVLGVTGSIACYKAAELASRLSQAGALVDVLLTASALEFITPLTFQSVTGRKAFTDRDLWGSEAHVLHVGVGHAADLVVIAPATANTIAKLAYGIADNLLTVTTLAASAPLLIAPAMDAGMFSHPATGANMDLLRQRGAIILGPVEGHLASGLSGPGRMAEPMEILGQIRYLLSRNGPLKGRKIVITAGGTQEALDPVRFITNRSSGKQGFALAQSALDWGAEVVLVAGVTDLVAPAGVRRVNVRSAQDMLEAVLGELSGTDALLMAAAVADFRPVTTSKQKVKREKGVPGFQLEATPDILSAVTQIKEETGFPGVTVGFAAESQDLLQNARRKLKSKKLDIIAANDISAPDAGFSVDTNRVTLLLADGTEEALPLASKDQVAEKLLAHVTMLLEARGQVPEWILHITSRQAWEGAQLSGEYRSEDFEKEGFIHASRVTQVLKVANRFYRGKDDLVLLWIDPSRVAPEVHWETADGEKFPHIYGPLNLEAVLDVEDFKPDPDGTFRKIKGVYHTNEKGPQL